MKIKVFSGIFPQELEYIVQNFLDEISCHEESYHIADFQVVPVGDKVMATLLYMQVPNEGGNDGRPETEHHGH